MPKIVLLPGDGIGPEVTAVAEKLLAVVASKFGHTFEFDRQLLGGIAIDETGNPFPDATHEACKSADAVLLGAVGGPQWDDPNATVRPEQGLLAIRKALGLFANLRPIKLSASLAGASPLKAEIVTGTDILFFRELTGGIYFGPDGKREVDGEEAAFSEMLYKRSEIERIVRLAAEAARGRRNRVTMVDKANVLEVSRLWRRVSAEVMADEFPDVKYEVVLVDAMAMHLLTRPRDFDVVVTGNLFGDILTDEASMLTGSLGLLPSASLGEPGPGLYEPIHGSAPDIAGRDVANPLAMILASAMMLRHSLKLADEADAVEAAVEKVLAAGHRTGDLMGEGDPVGTTRMGELVVDAFSG